MQQTHRSQAAKRGLFRRRTLVTDVVQGIIVGAVLAFITAQILMSAQVTTINGWRTIFRAA